MHTGKRIGRSVAGGLLGVALAAGLLVVPAPASAAEQSGGGSQLSIAVEPLADTASLGDGVDSYRIVVVNRGGGEVKEIDVSVPVSAGYSLAGASFNQSDAWVSALGAGSATVRIEQLRGRDDTLTGTLRFSGPRDAAANALAGRATATWDLDGKAYSIASNLPGASTVALSASAAGASRYSFSGGAFASNEPVTFWVTSSSGASTALVLDDGLLIVAPPADDDDDDEESFAAYLPASAVGGITVSLETAGLPAGSYTLAARGNWTGTLASAAFQVR